MQLPYELSCPSVGRSVFQSFLKGKTYTSSPTLLSCQIYSSHCASSVGYFNNTFRSAYTLQEDVLPGVDLDHVVGREGDVHEEPDLAG